MKKIVVAVTGSIAAYKSASLVRLFKKSGCEVRVVMTKSAEAFITSMTMQALSGHPVVNDILDPTHEMGMGHIELSRWADEIVIAPCSANMMAKLAHGIADDLVSAMCLASPIPIFIAPSMNRMMWSNPITQKNVCTLSENNYRIIFPESGEQACGEVGEGRMAEPEFIHDMVFNGIQGDMGLPLKGKKVVVTGGPTQEAIDPVRYISNHSSGKMACALADAFREQGADVVMILGPCEAMPSKDIKIIPVVSANEMLLAALSESKSADIFVGAAAVADYRVKEIALQKMKKQQGQESLTLELVKNDDILGAIGNLENRPFMVGFAAETSNLIEYAMEKLQRKKLNLICANDVSGGKVFGQDENNIVIIDTNNNKIELKTASKQIQAQKIVLLVINNFLFKK